MCTVYLWIGFAVNLASFLVPHCSTFSVAACEKIHIPIPFIHLILQCLKMHPDSTKVGTSKVGMIGTHLGPHWVHLWPAYGPVGTVVDPGSITRAHRELGLVCGQERLPVVFSTPSGRKCVAKPFVMEQVTAGRYPGCSYVINVHVRGDFSIK